MIHCTRKMYHEATCVLRAKSRSALSRSRFLAAQKRVTGPHHVFSSRRRSPPPAYISSRGVLSRVVVTNVRISPRSTCSRIEMFIKYVDVFMDEGYASDSSNVRIPKGEKNLPCDRTNRIGKIKYIRRSVWLCDCEFGIGMVVCATRRVMQHLRIGIYKDSVI